MKKFCTFLLCHLLASLSFSQTDSLTKTRFVIGLSAPELFHIGVNYDLASISQLGVTVGIGPTWGGVWPTINAEHRLYFGKIDPQKLRRKVFLKQGFTYYTAGDQNAFSFSVGGDLRSKNRARGWTIEIGAFILKQDKRDRHNKMYPALRFQRYGYFKKKAA